MHDEKLEMVIIQPLRPKGTKIRELNLHSSFLDMSVKMIPILCVFVTWWLPEQLLTMKIKFSSIFLIFIFILQFILFTPLVFAQDATWVTVEGIAAMENVTKEEARRIAIENALGRAVEEVVGTNIVAETIVINYRISGDIVKAMPYGKVIDREIIEEGVGEIRQKGRTTPSLIYRVKMKAKVIQEKGSIDPYFKINATLNRAVFKEGDDMQIKVIPTKDCYVTIFNILEDEKVIILIPNRYKGNNFIKAHETFIFPDEDDKKMGIKLISHVPEERKTVAEIIYVLGLKQPLRFDTARFRAGIFGVYNGKTAFINDLIKEIIDVPPSERAESFLQYRIAR